MYSEKVEVKVGVHQESLLSLLLFVIQVVVDVIAKNVGKDAISEVLYADDHVMSKTMMITSQHNVVVWFLPCRVGSKWLLVSPRVPDTLGSFQTKLVLQCFLLNGHRRKKKQKCTCFKCVHLSCPSSFLGGFCSHFWSCLFCGISASTVHQHCIFFKALHDVYPTIHSNSSGHPSTSAALSSHPRL